MNDKIKYTVEIWLRQSGNLTVDTPTLSALIGKGFGVNSLEQMRVKGVGLPFTKGDGLRSPVLYNLIDVAEWLETQKRKTV